MHWRAGKLLYPKGYQNWPFSADPVFFSEQGTVGVQLFCIWLSVKTSFCSCHKPSLNKYIYIYIHSSLAKPWNTIYFFNVVCTLLFCFGILDKKQKETTLCLNATNHRLRSLQKGKRIYHGPKIGATNLEAGLLILVLWPIFGSRIWPLFWGHKTQTGSTQYGQQVCYCRRKLTAAHIRDTPRVHCMPEKFALPLIWGSGFGALGPPRLWEKASPMP